MAGEYAETCQKMPRVLLSSVENLYIRQEKSLCWVIKLLKNNNICLRNSNCYQCCRRRSPVGADNNKGNVMKKLFALALFCFTALSANAAIVSADFRTEADLPNAGSAGPLVHERLNAAVGS